MKVERTRFRSWSILQIIYVLTGEEDGYADATSSTAETFMKVHFLSHFHATVEPKTGP